MLDIIGNSSDLSMLQETINFILFSLQIDGIPKLEDHNEGLGGRDVTSPEKVQPTASSSGFLFWRRQSSPATLDSLPGSSSSVPSMSHSELMLSLMSCTYRQYLEATSFGSSHTSSSELSPLVSNASAHEAENFANAEKIFCDLVTSRNFEEFVTCKGRRKCVGSSIVDGIAPSKDEAMLVLKHYKRVLNSVGWKLDRKKMFALREKGFASGDRIISAVVGDNVIGKHVIGILHLNLTLTS